MMRLRAKTANEELSEAVEVLRCRLFPLTLMNDQNILITYANAIIFYRKNMNILRLHVLIKFATLKYTRG